MLKRISITCITLCMTVIAVHAQTYTDHLQKKQSGNGTVTVNQSKELEALINGSASKSTTGTNKNTGTTAKPSTTATTASSSSSSTAKSSSDTNEERRSTRPRESYSSKSDSENKNIVRRERKTDTDEEETVSRSVTTGKKIMKGSRKVTGYRIQVYAGGNSRKDREKAQQAGNKVKSHFPSYPVFVHFYSPSWKCRVGNFVEYKEAEQALRRIRALGYKQAVIVKGKISVQ